MKYSRDRKLSTFFGKNRSSTVSEDKYHYIVDCFENEINKKTSLVTKGKKKVIARNTAENLAEDWVNKN